MEPEDPQKRFPHRFNQTIIHPSAWVAPGAQVHGDILIGEDSSIWFNSVLRGDVNYIRIGDRTNIQDLSMVHVTHHGDPTIIGNNVTVGHSCILHACKVGNFSLIGMGSCILDGAEIGDFVLLGAGSLVTQKTKIPSFSKAFGRPAKVVGELSPEEKKYLEFSANHYVAMMKTYRGVVK